MANETTYAASGDLTSTYLAMKVYELVSDTSDIRNTVKMLETANMRGSLSQKVPQIQLNDVMTAPGEATDTTATVLTDDSVTVTAARQTIMYKPTDEMLIGTAVNIPKFAEGVAGAYIRRCAQLIGLAIDGFTATAGTTAVTLTVDDIYDAYFDLIIGGGKGNPTCVLDPTQYTHFLASLRTEGGAMQYVPSTSKMLEFNSMDVKGSWNGVEFVTSQQVYTDGTDFFGAMYFKDAVALLEMPVAAAKQAVPNDDALSAAPDDATLWIEKRRIGGGITEIEGSALTGVAINEDVLGSTIQTAI